MSASQHAPRAEKPRVSGLDEKEARAAAEHVLSTHGRVAEVVARDGDVYVFAYVPFAGAERARELEDALVTVTPVDDGHVRVQVAGVTMAGRVPLRM